MNKLVIEDIAPTKSRSAETTEFPAIINAMNSFDRNPHGAQNISEMRHRADLHLQKVVQVNLL